MIILDALTRLELLALEAKKKVIIFFDEYQHVLALPETLDYEASLRSFAQKSQHTICLFSGSNQQILQNMFNDNSRPFYNMCDHLLLERISRDEFYQHLRSISQIQWNKSLSDDAIHLILDLTACHTYYVNALCRRVWAHSALATENIIIEEWNKLASEKRYEISHDFGQLTPIQRSILIELSDEPFAHPTSKESIQRINASVSGIKNAMTGLIKYDYVFQQSDGKYRVLNPLMEYVLKQETNKIKY